MTRQPKYAKRRDTSESAVVRALEAAGCKVYKALPCDLLVRVPRDPPGILRCLEAKTARGKRDPKLKLDKRQMEQQQFVADTGTPYVTDALEALRAVGVVGFGDGR